MTSKEAINYLTSKVFTGGNGILEIEAEECKKTILNDLERLEELEKENQELKDYIKALDKACEILDWDCPVSQELVDDLDCENCNDNYKECWKKYFLKVVLENEK